MNEEELTYGSINIPTDEPGTQTQPRYDLVALKDISRNFKTVIDDLAFDVRSIDTKGSSTKETCENMLVDIRSRQIACEYLVPLYEYVQEVVKRIEKEGGWTQ